MTSSKMGQILRPQSMERIKLLRSGREVAIAKSTPRFRKWTGPVPLDDFNGKPLIEFEGKVAFAELAILRVFKQAGWEGRWIDSFLHRHLSEYWPTPINEPLPAKQQSILDRIRTEAGRDGGCFDVFCWRGEELLFAESKWHDQLLESQIRWLEAAIDVGIPLTSFMLIQWEFETP